MYLVSGQRERHNNLLGASILAEQSANSVGFAK